MDKQTLTVPEAAKLLGIGRTAAYEAARNKQIPTIRIGRRLLVPAIALERLLSGTQGSHLDGSASLPAGHL